MRAATLAVDYGERRIGLAMSDPLGIIASGIGTIDGGSDAPARIAAIAHERGARRIVVGLPLTLKGETGAAATSVLAFVEKLRAVSGLPVDTLDERFTSSIAERTIRELGVGKQKRKQKGKIDEISAVLLLQDYLSMHGSEG